MGQVGITDTLEFGDRPSTLPLPLPFDEEDPLPESEGNIAASSSEPTVGESPAFPASNSEDVPQDGKSVKGNVKASVGKVEYRMHACTEEGGITQPLHQRGLSIVCMHAQRWEGGWGQLLTNSYKRHA